MNSNSLVSTCIKEEITNELDLASKGFPTNDSPKSIDEVFCAFSKNGCTVYEMENLNEDSLFRLFAHSEVMSSGHHKYSCHLCPTVCSRSYASNDELDAKNLLIAHLLNHVESLLVQAKKDPSHFKDKKYFPYNAVKLDVEIEHGFLNSCQKGLSEQIDMSASNGIATFSPADDSEFAIANGKNYPKSINIIKTSKDSDEAESDEKSTLVSSKDINKQICVHVNQPNKDIEFETRLEPRSKVQKPRSYQLDQSSESSSSESDSKVQKVASFRKKIFQRRYSLSSTLRNRNMCRKSKFKKVKKNVKNSNSSNFKEAAVRAPHENSSPIVKNSSQQCYMEMANVSPLSNGSIVDGEIPKSHIKSIRTQTKETNQNVNLVKKSKNDLENFERALIGFWNDHLYAQVKNAHGGGFTKSKPEVPNNSCGMHFRSTSSPTPSTSSLVVESNSLPTIQKIPQYQPYHLKGPSSKKVEVATDPKLKAKALRLISDLRVRKPKEVMVCTVRVEGKSQASYVVQNFYVCEICGKKFTAPNSLYGHYRGHAGIKPFKCKECGQTFTRSHSLSYHSMIHANTARFKCSYCGKMFRHPTHYKEHLNRHTGNEPYRCMDCPRRFRTRNTYRRHAIAKHNRVATSGVLPINSRVLTTTKSSQAAS